jgi:predicted TPR repeat methyltransferase
VLRPQVRTLVGVDLSAGMLRGAQARGCYDELVRRDIEAFCAAVPGRFDLLAAADVCNYLGETAGLFDAAHTALRPGGLLACTFEQGNGTGDVGYRLTTTGRYVHDERAVVARLRAARFADIEVTHDVLRRERGTEVAGLFVLAHRP